jgi:hypothetical protein
MTSCGTPYVVSVPVSPCNIGPAPTLDIAPREMGVGSFIPMEDVIKLAKYLNAVHERDLAVARCAYVRVTND